MALQVYESGTQTMTTTTQTLNTDHIKGKILKVQIVASASTDFHLWVDASDTGTKAIVDEDIVGTSSSKVTVNTTLTIYPVVAQYVGSTNAITDPDQFSPPVVDDILKVSVANGAKDDTWSIVIWYDDMSGRTN